MLSQLCSQLIMNPLRGFIITPIHSAIRLATFIAIALTPTALLIAWAYS